ncbi:cytochrome P450 [Nonomuraea roseoviolacea]|uniref:Cytochrome P450 n=1 Tax=Nonomuraea roseoviolacea subsp. carminata TaxID=160689 RepID=A0ABT1KAW9_9ACTN|nr:cytochrome P450 [Nonomuraea roseoviolacea]MCP2351163.1 cytochrome P450 [Nonomuraea roseoviolacea subsp. carminata]
MTESVPTYPFDREEALRPPREWGELQEKCPVAHVRLPSGDTAQLVTRYDDVRALLTDPRFRRGGQDAARIATTQDGGLFARNTMTITQGEGHRRWRRLLSPSFTIRRMEAWRPRVQAMCDELVDDLLAAGSPADLSVRLGLPLPVRVICALVGAPAEDQDRFAHWSRVMLTLTRHTQEEVQQAYEEFDAYVSALVDARRAEPGDDLLSELTQISDSEDGRLSHEELIATVRALLLAGHETTSNMIAIMVAMLLAEPERYQAVIDDPGLVPGTVEEVLRLDSTLSVVGFPRVAGEDLDIAGVKVAAGSTLIPCRPAANRDPRKFADPERFDPHRDNANQHLTFGAGPHYCLGQPLARLELQVVLGTLVRRLPGLRLRDGAEALRLRTGLLSGGLENVWVAW